MWGAKLEIHIVGETKAAKENKGTPTRLSGEVLIAVNIDLKFDLNMSTNKAFHGRLSRPFLNTLSEVT